MKTNRNIRLFAILTLCAIALVVMAFTPAIAAIGTILAVGGAGVSGTVTTENSADASPNLLVDDISKTVTEMLPSRTPLDTIMRTVRSAGKADSIVHRYYSVTSKPFMDIPDNSVSGDGSASDKAAKAYTYVSGNGLTNFYISVTNDMMWTEYDTLLMRDLLIPANGIVSADPGTVRTDVAFFVVSKAEKVLRLMPLNGVKGPADGANAAKYVMPNFEATTKLYRMGKAAGELDMQTGVFTMIPDDEVQYGQNFISQIEESTFQKLTKKEVVWGFSDYERNNLYDTRATMENSFINGIKSMTVNPITGKIHYTTEGIARRISNKIAYGTGGTDRTVAFKDIVNWGKTVFTSNSGSDTKILLAGSTLMAAMHSIETLNKQIQGRDPVTKWGLRFREIDLNFGQIWIRPAPLFDEMGWDSAGLILDIDHIYKKDFIPMTVTELDLKKSGTRNADAKVIQEVSFMTLTYPECHAIIKPKP